MPKAASKPIIAVDIDDVLAANAEGFVKYSNKKWGTNLSADDYDEHWAKIWEVDDREVRKRADQIHKDRVFAKHRHFTEAEEVLVQLAKRYKLVVVTSRRQSISKDTLGWLDKHFKGIFSEVHFAGIWDDLEKKTLEKLDLTKGQLAKEIGANYLVDDHPKHCIAAAKAGIKAVLFGDYGWNRDIKPRTNMIRAKNWQEVLEYFNAENRRKL